MNKIKTFLSDKLLSHTIPVIFCGMFGTPTTSFVTLNSKKSNKNANKRIDRTIKIKTLILFLTALYTKACPLMSRNTNLVPAGSAKTSEMPAVCLYSQARDHSSMQKYIICPC